MVFKPDWTNGVSNNVTSNDTRNRVKEVCVVDHHTELDFIHIVILKIGQFQRIIDLPDVGFAKYSETDVGKLYLHVYVPNTDTNLKKAHALRDTINFLYPRENQRK